MPLYRVTWRWEVDWVVASKSAYGFAKALKRLDAETVALRDEDLDEARERFPQEFVTEISPAGLLDYPPDRYANVRDGVLVANDERAK